MSPETAIPLLTNAYADLTATKLRVVSESMRRRAVEFLAVFTVEELERVIRWMQMNIIRETKGFSVLSLQWRLLLGEWGDGGAGLERFQERLRMAEESCKRGWSYGRKWEGNERKVERAANPMPIATAAPMPTPQPTAGSAERAAAVRELFQRIK